MNNQNEQTTTNDCSFLFLFSIVSKFLWVYGLLILFVFKPILLLLDKLCTHVLIKTFVSQAFYQMIIRATYITTNTDSSFLHVRIPETFCCLKSLSQMNYHFDVSLFIIISRRFVLCSLTNGENDWGLFYWFD